MKTQQTQTTLSQDEKEELSHLSYTQDESISGKDLLRGFFIIFMIFCVFAPKVYVSNQIYYLSRDIAKTSYHLDLLNEENKNLKQELEDFRFQQILRMEQLNSREF